MCIPLRKSASLHSTSTVRVYSGMVGQKVPTEVESSTYEGLRGADADKVAFSLREIGSKCDEWLP